MATDKIPASLGKTGPKPAGPTQDAKSGAFAERTPVTGALTIENNGGTGAEGDWAVLDSAGTKLNAPIKTAQGLAYWLKQRPGYAQRVENLDMLGVVEPHESQQSWGSRGGYRIADIATGKYQPR